MNIFIKIFIIISLFIPIFAWAVTAVVEINTGMEEINAFEGILVLPENMHTNKIQTGNSIILFWITPPKQIENTITFAGITPGGFSGIYPMFTVSGEFSAQDLERVRFESVNALKDDGSGTSAPVTITLSSVELKNDTEPPEDFIPVIANDPNIFSGKWFVAFATQDKGTGINHYEIKENKKGIFSLFVKWHKEQSPYVLNDQQLESYVLVKAVDNAGNKQIMEIPPVNPLNFYENFLFWFIIILIVMFSIKNIIRRKCRNIFYR